MSVGDNNASATEEKEDLTFQSKLVDYWEEFIKNYNTEAYDKVTKQSVSTHPYFDQIQNMRNESAVIEGGPMGTSIFRINYQDFITYAEQSIEKDKRNSMIYQLTNQYEQAQEAIAEAVYNVLLDIQHDYAEAIKGKILVWVYNYSETKEISDLSSIDVEKFNRVEGIVTQYDNDKQIAIIHTTWQCENGHELKVDGGANPKKCYSCDGVITSEIEHKRDLQDFMYVRIQQRSDRMRDGQFDPKELDIVFFGTELVQRIYRNIEPGLYVAANGVIKLTERSKSNPNTASIEMLGSSLEIMPESNIVGDDPNLDALVRTDIPDDQIDSHFKKLVNSICPHLQGMDLIKTALLLQAAGCRHKEDKGRRIRGDTNILLLGDSAVGKTDLLKFMIKIRPRSVYAVGRSASAVGLTAGIQPVEITRGGSRISSRRISFGAYATANTGLVSVDELDKRDKIDFMRISHAMDDWQEIHLDMAGVNKTIPAKCGSLHAANPTKNYGKYDPSDNIFNQTNFHEWLFSRYDLIFIILDENTDASRQRFTSQLADSYQKIQFEDSKNKNKHTGFETDVFEEYFSPAYLRREIVYVREKYHPILKPFDEQGKPTIPWITMMQFWSRYNKQNMLPQIDPEDTLSEGSKLHIPLLDKRKPNSLIRLAEQSARLHRRSEVLEEDMSIAINLMKVSVGQLIPQRGIGTKETRIASAKLNKSIANDTRRALEREYKQRITQYRQNMWKFLRYLDNMTFDKCTSCNRAGKRQITVMDVREYEKCTDCQGTGGQYVQFTYNHIISHILGNNHDMIEKDVKEYFNKCIKAEFIRPTGKGGYYIVQRDLTDRNILSEMESEVFISNDDDGDGDDEEEDEQKELQKQLEMVSQPNIRRDKSTEKEVLDDLNRFKSDNSGVYD